MQGASPPLKDIIDAAIQRGMTRQTIADASGCTRMQVWRLYVGKTSENSRSGQNLRLALQSGSVSSDSLDQTISRIAKGDPRRAAIALQMLHLLSEFADAKV